jgi:hypothetical protein
MIAEPRVNDFIPFFASLQASMVDVETTSDHLCGFVATRIG